MKKSLLAFILLILVFWGCSEDAEYDPGIGSQVATSSGQLAFLTAEQIKQAIKNEIDINIDLDIDTVVSYDVSIYRLTYETIDVDGKEIEASGAIIVPQTNTPVPILSYQHGTIYKQSDAPSAYDTGLEVTGLATALGGAGYAVIVPDYLGYGVSSEYLHPYEHGKSLGRACFDMIQASREFFEKNSIQTSDKLFITGYSEGGYATMALHKHIEENSDWAITMSAPAAGAYNKTAFAQEIFDKDEDLSFLKNYMWVIDSYNWVYGLDRNWDQIAKEPFATTLNKVQDPMTYRDTDIPSNPATLFTNDFSGGIKQKTDTEFLDAIADNDIFDWSPLYPITLYYGTEDDFVFPINSTTAYDAIRSNGSDITLEAFAGENHSSAFPLYVEKMYNLFQSLK